MHRFSTFLTLPTLLLMLAGCAASPPPAPAPSGVLDPAGLDPSTLDPELTAGRPPSRVGEYRLADVHRFPEPMGFAFRYASPTGLRPDVYVYPIQSDATSGPRDRDEQVREESAALEEGLAVMREQGRFDAFRVLAEEPVEVPVGETSVRGWHVHVVLVRGAEESDSHQHVFAVGDHFVKVRTTYPRREDRSAELGGFLEALLPMVMARGVPQRTVQRGAGPGRRRNSTILLAPREE